MLEENAIYHEEMDPSSIYDPIVGGAQTPIYATSKSPMLDNFAGMSPMVGSFSPEIGTPYSPMSGGDSPYGQPYSPISSSSSDGSSPNSMCIGSVWGGGVCEI